MCLPFSRERARNNNLVELCICVGFIHLGAVRCPFIINFDLVDVACSNSPIFVLTIKSRTKYAMVTSVGCKMGTFAARYFH